MGGVSGISKPMVWVRVAFHENDGNHENDENDEDNSDSYKQGVECLIRGNHGNHENDENHENPGCKPRVPQTIGLEIPEGGVLQYKWEAYCDTNGRSADDMTLSLESRGTKSNAIQNGGILQYKWEVHCHDYLRSILSTFSLLISEDFWVSLSFVSDRSVFAPSDKCAESTAITGKREGCHTQKSSLISKEKVNKVVVVGFSDILLTLSDMLLSLG